MMTEEILIGRVLSPITAVTLTSKFLTGKRPFQLLRLFDNEGGNISLSYDEIRELKDFINSLNLDELDKRETYTGATQ